MIHRRTHPDPVEGCERCRWASVGVQKHAISQGADPTRRIPVTVDDGPHRGRIGGFHTEHMDGRQDATVAPAAIRVRAQSTEER